MIRQERVQDIKDGIDAYTSMAAIMTDGNPILVTIMADWLTTLVRSLVEWDAMTKEENDLLFALLASEAAERVAESGGQDEATQMLIQHQGI